MRYVVSDDFVQINETSGTVQNASKINIVEVSDSTVKGSGIMLYPMDRFTFSTSIYARCIESGGAEVRVVPFEAGVQGGGGDGSGTGTDPNAFSSVTVDSGRVIFYNGAGLSVGSFVLPEATTADVVIGSVSSTVDGGLWYETMDELPTLKMSCGGADFFVKFQSVRDGFFGNKLFINGHKFQFTGFADLILHNNNFYAATDTNHTTPLGSITVTDGKYRFVFTDETALDVDCDTFAITQTDDDRVTYSLDLSALASGEGTWTYTNAYDEDAYRYTATPAATYTRVSATEYQKNNNSATLEEIVIYIAFDKAATYKNNASALEDYLSVEYVYDDGNLSRVDVTILDKDILTANNGSVFLGVDDTDAHYDNDGNPNDQYVPVYIKLAETCDADRRIDEPAKLEEADGVYTYTAAEKRNGFYAVVAPDATGDQDATVVKYQDFGNAAGGGDFFTVAGLSAGLLMDSTDGRLYTLSYAGKDSDGNVTVKSGALAVGMVDGATLRIFTTDALANFDPETAKDFTVTLTDNDYTTEGRAHNKYNYQLAFDQTLTTPNTDETHLAKLETDSAAITTTYTLNPEQIGWYFEDAGQTVLGGQSRYTTSYTYVGTASSTAIKAFSLLGAGLMSSGLDNLFIYNEKIYNYDPGTLRFNKDPDTQKYSIVITPDSTKEVGTFANNVVSLGLNFFKANPTAGDKISISSNSYTLKLAKAKRSASSDAEAGIANLTLTYNAAGYTAGYVETTAGKEFTYRDVVGRQPFTISNITTNLSPRINPINSETGALTTTKTINGVSETVTIATVVADDNTGKSYTVTLFKDIFTNDPNTDTTQTLTFTDAQDDVTYNLQFDSYFTTPQAVKTFAAATNAGSYTCTISGSTVGWQLGTNGLISYNTVELNGKTFTIENLRTDLGNLALDANGYINATNGSTIGRMLGSTITLYDNAVHKLAAPILSGTDAADFTLILPT